MTDQKRLNRYISQMEAFRRKHEEHSVTAPWKEGKMHRGGLVPELRHDVRPPPPAPSRFTHSDNQYAWASIDPDKYGGSPQEDHG
jgi:hypothetical protein